MGGRVKKKKGGGVFKYGYASFSFTVLEICKPEDLIQREQHYIDLLRPYYNLCRTAGSTLGKAHTEETKVKIGDSKSGTPPSPIPTIRIVGLGKVGK